MAFEDFLDQFVLCAFWTVIAVITLYFAVKASRNWLRQIAKDGMMPEYNLSGIVPETVQRRGDSDTYEFTAKIVLRSAAGDYLELRFEKLAARVESHGCKLMREEGYAGSIWHLLSEKGYGRYWNFSMDLILAQRIEEELDARLRTALANELTKAIT